MTKAEINKQDCRHSLATAGALYALGLLIMAQAGVDELLIDGWQGLKLAMLGIFGVALLHAFKAARLIIEGR